ncbi:putative quinol monooxygenase [Burkholderia sp. Ac-20379]|uniref:putative quinol monooxygenase n=1 Tax=Burkholderia sp. Ac-20379 TaxID=2703900 RepID=UPI00197CE587|nr:putative quinol monooxygenase [Burkholderia sp. Ac-20379]MBN3725343.1 antibiotic biosynthesis monooxygenase [Burkholderia sp. Ac-20379]
MSSEIQVVAVLQGTPGSGDALAEAAERVAGPSREEAGCLGYVAYRDTDRADRIVFIERWRDRDAIAQHERTPHFQALVAAVKPLLAEPLHISFLGDLKG